MSGILAHVHQEVKINGVWHHYSDTTLHGLPAVANLLQILPHNDGLPPEISEVTRFDAGYFPEDTFQPSWMDSKQVRVLEDVMYQAFHPPAVSERITSGKGYMPEPHNVWGWLFGGSWGAFDKYPDDRREGLEDVRFVYWFMH